MEIQEVKEELKFDFINENFDPFHSILTVGHENARTAKTIMGVITDKFVEKVQKKDKNVSVEEIYEKMKSQIIITRMLQYDWILITPFKIIYSKIK